MFVMISYEKPSAPHSNMKQQTMQGMLQKDDSQMANYTHLSQPLLLVGKMSIHSLLYRTAIKECNLVMLPFPPSLTPPSLVLIPEPEVQ